ncbi:hypothetical protein Ocin01_15815 [Orchesella cincta]|uniref:Uncharacterized protein n=1 Tax=Orchesella cincta TaxID=48709 RepID=A0A1D2MD38_ORCCI|nr:hypothetical protein Ocin01_15815 [Orchesella cincta]
MMKDYLIGELNDEDKAHTKDQGPKKWGEIVVLKIKALGRPGWFNGSALTASLIFRFFFIKN